MEYEILICLYNRITVLQVLDEMLDDSNAITSSEIICVEL